MPAARQPVNPRSHSVGIDQRLVRIMDIPAGQNLAICADRGGTEVRVPVFSQRTKSMTLPKVGENWLLTQENGHWAFAVFLGTKPEDFAPDPGSIHGTAIADGSMPGTAVVTGSMPGTALAPGSLPAAAIADGSIPGTILAPGSLPAAAVADGSLPGTVLEDASVPVSKLTGGLDNQTFAGAEFSGGAAFLDQVGPPPAGVAGQSFIWSDVGQPALIFGSGLNMHIMASATCLVFPVTQTTTGLTTLLTFQIPGNDIIAGNYHSIEAQGTFSTGTSAPSSGTFTVTYATVPIATLNIPAAGLVSGISGASWLATAKVNWISASESIVSLEIGWHTGGGVANTIKYFVGAIDTSGQSTASPAFLSLKFQWGSVNAGTQITINGGIIGRWA